MWSDLNRKLKLLLIEDDEDDYLLLKGMMSDVLPSRYEIDWISNYSQSLEVACNGNKTSEYDVCLIDYRLGDGTGLDLINALIEHGFQAPMILLTGQGSYEVDLEAMKHGISDYLDKSELTPRLLERSIRYAMERKRAELELIKYQESLEYLVAERTKELVEERNRLHQANKQLTDAIANIKTLEGLLPICAWCKKIRNDEGYWMQLEAYFLTNSLLQFTHGICPDCRKRVQEEHR